MENPDLHALTSVLDSYSAQFGPFDPQTLAVANQLAIAYWRAGDADRAATLLTAALECISSPADAGHPVRLELLGTLAELLLEQRLPQQSAGIFGELWDCCTRQSGPNHPSSLAAKGDLAMALFTMGEAEEAELLESEAFEAARLYLGTRHPVTTVLSWNRVLRHESAGNPGIAQSILIAELVWLLAEEPATLDIEQNVIRTMLAARLQWDSAGQC